MDQANEARIVWEGRKNGTLFFFGEESPDQAMLKGQNYLWMVWKDGPILEGTKLEGLGKLPPLPIDETLECKTITPEFCKM